MDKAKLIFWVDTALFSLLVLAILSIGPEIFSHGFMHVIPGLLIMAGAIIHIYLHWDWIKAVFRNYRKMGRAAQENAMLDLALLCAYLIAGGMGILARLMLFIFPVVHIPLGILHVILSALLLTLQTIHLARHFKWIKKNVRVRIIDRLSPVARKNHS